LRGHRFFVAPSPDETLPTACLAGRSYNRRVTSEAASTENESSTLARVLRAFRSRNYALFFSGQLISLVGTFLTQVATAWLVYRLARSSDRPEAAPLALGIVGFVGQLPLFVLAPFAGVWVDRWNRRKLLVVTQTLAMIQSFALAYFAWTHITIPGVVALALAQGLINAFDIPARQAFLVEIVDRADLANAIALNSTMVHGARLVGPALAGLLIHSVGEALCFFLDGISYVGVIAALVMITVHAVPRPPRDTSIWTDLVEGFRYVWGFRPIRALLLLMAITSLAGVPALTVLMPIFADALGGSGSGGDAGARTMGLLMGASGLGALCGAIYLASRHSVVGLGKVIVTAAIVYAVALVGFSLVDHLWLALLIMPLAGFGMMANFASANTVLQTLADDDKRGRVMSFFTMAFIGMTPFGNLLAGWAAARLGGGVVGAHRTLVLSAGVCLIAALAFAIKLPALRQIVRPIYVKKGIIPEVAIGMQASEEVPRIE
jgi:MFS family permease